MNEPLPENRPLDLEKTSLDELERTPVTGIDPGEAVPEVSPPHTTRRCDSSQRELLNNHFPVEEANREAD